MALKPEFAKACSAYCTEALVVLEETQAPSLCQSTTERKQRLEMTVTVWRISCEARAARSKLSTRREVGNILSLYLPASSPGFCPAAGLESQKWIILRLWFSWGVEEAL